ncbi:MAG: hypothetical protein GDA56_15055 [Hormoscilla sp. GM7CHS1pb]|nr:hypothetical protein [Hormoscilla sp. GM7CHS1pb]
MVKVAVCAPLRFVAKDFRPHYKPWLRHAARSEKSRSAIGKEVAIAQVSKITEKLIASDPLYQEKLDPEKMIEHMVKLFDEFSTAEIKELEGKAMKN